ACCSAAPVAIASVYACSNCWASSATISASRSGEIARGPRRWRTNAAQSRMVEPRQGVERGDEFAPASPLFGERLAPGGGQPVVAAAALPGFLDPPALHQLLALHAVEHRIKRGDVELQAALRLRFD